MNKLLKTLMIAAVACVTLCGTTFAAPHGGRSRGPKPAPRHHVVKHRTPPKSQQTLSLFALKIEEEAP